MPWGRNKTSVEFNQEFVPSSASILPPFSVNFFSSLSQRQINNALSLQRADDLFWTIPHGRVWGSLLITALAILFDVHTNGFSISNPWLFKKNQKNLMSVPQMQQKKKREINNFYSQCGLQKTAFLLFGWNNLCCINTFFFGKVMLLSVIR